MAGLDQEVGDKKIRDKKACDKRVRDNKVRVKRLRPRLAAWGAFLLVVVLAGGCGLHTKSAPVGASESVFHLKPGECLIPPTDVKAEVSSVKVVSCREPHTQEVYALVSDPGGDNYPGTSKLESFANGNCLQHYQSYVGVAYQRSSLFFTYLLPSVRSWAAKDRTIVCVITTTGQKLTRSVRDSKR